MSFRQRRSFLFLQGLSTPFFVRLAREIATRGHTVHRINLSGGDRAFWSRLGAVDYRGRFSHWQEFVGQFMRDNAVTDVILFGDCRPYHRVAVNLAQSRGIAVHVFEEGYFRPEWVTLEQGGSNAYSSLPRDPDTFLAEAAMCPVEDRTLAVSGGMARRVRWEIWNQIATLALSPLYPHYQRHRGHHPLVEMCGWLKRLAKRPAARRHAARIVREIDAKSPAYFLLPLQLESDYQIRQHSPFKSMAHVMEVVLESFARSAPDEARILIKLHPLDNGLTNFRRQATEIAGRLKLGLRVIVMDGGHLPTLLTNSEGVVVVNSTTGLSALHHGRPVTVLGDAIFDVPMLTFQGPLDRFWTEKSPPDPGVFQAFRRVVLARTQVNGSFFTPHGIAAAVDGALSAMQVASVGATVPYLVPAPREHRGSSAALTPAE